MSNIITVYQSLNQKEKISNYSPQPELVYSRITTLSLILRQIEKEGLGLIFCHNISLIKNVQQQAGKERIVVTYLHELKTIAQVNPGLLVVILNPADKVKVSELNKIAKDIVKSGIELKWISILQQPGFNQLFKWELKYN